MDDFWGPLLSRPLCFTADLGGNELARQLQKMKTAWQGDCQVNAKRICLGFREEKRAQTQTSESDIFRWGRGLPREGVGAKRFGMSLETREFKLFRRYFSGFCCISNHAICNLPSEDAMGGCKKEGGGKPHE